MRSIFVLCIFSSCLTSAMPLCQHYQPSMSITCCRPWEIKQICDKTQPCSVYKCCKPPNRLLVRKNHWGFFCIQIRISSCVNDKRKVRHDKNNSETQANHHPGGAAHHPAGFRQTWTAFSPTYLLNYSLRTPVNCRWQNYDKGKLII